MLVGNPLVVTLLLFWRFFQQLWHSVIYDAFVDSSLVVSLLVLEEDCEYLGLLRGFEEEFDVLCSFGDLDILELYLFVMQPTHG